MQEANAISFLPERQPRALTFITANAPTKKAGMYAGLPSFNDPVPWRPLAVLSHFFGCGSATVTVAGRVAVRIGVARDLANGIEGVAGRVVIGIGFRSPPTVEIVTVAGDRAQRIRHAHQIVARVEGVRGHEAEGIGGLGEIPGGVESIGGGAAPAGAARLPAGGIV